MKRLSDSFTDFMSTAGNKELRISVSIIIFFRYNCLKVKKFDLAITKMFALVASWCLNKKVNFESCFA